MLNDSSPASYPMQNIMHPGDHDLLLGRGGETNHHKGNVNFRKLVIQFKPRYRAAARADKPKVAAELVAHWRNLSPPGRFLKRLKPGKPDSPWRDIGDMAAKRKTSKSLGERDYKTDDEDDDEESRGSRKRSLRTDNSPELPVLKSKPRHMNDFFDDGGLSSQANPFGSMTGAPTDVPLERNSQHLMAPSHLPGTSIGPSFSPLPDFFQPNAQFRQPTDIGIEASGVDPFSIPTAAALVRSVFGSSDSDDSDDEEDGKLPAS